MERGGDVARRERTCVSEFGVRRFMVLVNYDIIYADFLIGKSSTGKESISLRPIRVRGFG
jgi:hypothetical protein